MTKLIIVVGVLAAVFILGWNAGQGEAEAPVIKTVYVESEPEVVTETETVTVEAELPESCYRIVTRVQDLVKTEGTMVESSSQVMASASDAHKFLVQGMHTESTEALQSILDSSDELALTSVDRSTQVTHLLQQLEVCETDIAYPGN